MPFCTKHELVAFYLATAVSLASIHYTGADVAASRLQIGVKHRPDVCTRRAQPGDEVSVHYKVCRYPDLHTHRFGSFLSKVALQAGV